MSLSSCRMNLGALILIALLTTSFLAGCPPEPVPPTAGFTASPTQGAVPLNVSFTDTSTPGSAVITEWAWDFGDGASSIEQNPVHRYDAVGTFTVTLTVTTNDGSNSSNGAASIVVDKATPTISAWPVAADISYGQPLADAILDGGTASVPGTFTFDAPDMIPDVGMRSEMVTFTPDNTGLFNTLSQAIPVTVKMATPVVSAWPVANPITYGQPLSDATLDGGEASVEGTFLFTEPDFQPNAGAYDAAIVFNPVDSDHYLALSAMVSVAINPLTPTITQWPTADPISYGQPISAALLKGGSASVDGTFSYNAPATLLPAGSYNVPVTFMPSDTNNCNPVSATVPVLVDKATPVINTWPAASPIQIGQALQDSLLSGATASVTGTFTFDAPAITPSTGTYYAAVTFAASDTANFKNVTGTVAVIVKPEIGEIWYVTAMGAGSGTSWKDSFSSIQNAIDAASKDGGGEVWVAEGIYKATTEPIVTMTENVHLYGGFSGRESTRDERNPIDFISAIDGDARRQCVRGSNNATLDGFRIQNGFSRSNSDGGGGMLNDGVSPTVVDCTFSDNYSQGIGSGMTNINHAAPTVTRCTFSNNNDDAVIGGAMVNTDSSPIVEDCRFLKNSSNFQGGAISNMEGAAPTILHCTFRQNNSSCGGAILNYFATPTIIACEFNKNVASSGGAIANANSPTIIEDCLFVENFASGIGDGGAICNSRSASSIINCVFTKNEAENTAGAIYNSSSSPNIFNSLFTENHAPSGAAIYNDGSSPIITNCILWGDFSERNSTEIACATYQSSPPSKPVVSYSCIQNGYPGTGNIATDPKLATARQCLFRLTKDSPCINAGTKIDAPNTDIRCVARPIGRGIDMGPYEFDDADGDGISDTWEKDSFGNLTQASAESDQDGDGLSDINEWIHGTNPMVQDSDSDGISDKDELDQGLDPTRTTIVYRVNVANTSGVENGLTWNTAFTSIQRAVDAVETIGEGQVWVAAGVYTSVRNQVVSMQNRVHLFGGFAGTETNLTQRNWEKNLTIVDGESSRVCVEGADNAVLDGFVLRNGFSMYRCGGGMLNQYNTPLVYNCLFTFNEASYGGGMYNQHCFSPVIDNCKFVSNTATLYGGGLYMDKNSSPTITRCSFVQNTAKRAAGGLNIGESPNSKISDCAFTGNSVGYKIDSGYRGGNGGGVSIDSCSATLTNCLFIDNSAYTSENMSDSGFGGNGGGLNVGYSDLQLINCVFTGNSASSPSLRDDLVGNANGGGIYCGTSSLSIDHCIFYQNLAYLTDNNSSLTNYSGQGGAIYDMNYDYNFSNFLFTPISISNSIFWNNAASVSGNEIHTYIETPSAAPVISYSCIKGGYDGEGNIDADPLLIDTHNAYGRIRPNSPCIDAGKNSDNPMSDFRGVSRPQGAAPDMGAYELDDADSDGISDTWEQTHFGDLSIASAISDADGDAVSDLEENLYGSNPLLQDSDNDGFLDIDEIEEGFDPAQTSRICRVNATNTSGTEDGRSWETAFSSIQNAIDTVSSGGDGQIWVAAGTYTGTGPNVVTMAKYVHLYGGFAGSETSLQQRNWEIHKTIIDGQSERRGVAGANHAKLDGFTIQHGDAPDYPCCSQGYTGMYNYFASPTVAHCIFTKNGLYSIASGMCNYKASPLVIDCTFSENSACGMDNTKSSPEVRNCIFMANSSSGMANSYGEPLLFNCTFIQNSTKYKGAGMRNRFTSPTIINSVFSGNVCQEGGGGMYNHFSDPVLINCTFSENETVNPKNNTTCSGGAIYNEASNPILNNCIVWNNSSCYNGTEIFNVYDRYNPSIPIISYSCIVGGYEGIGNIDVDPLLIPTMGSRGAIQPNSPCINAGTADGAPEEDLRGVPRPQDGAVDMGAYELDDLDGDGISDAWEQRSFGNLTQATEISDADNDGLSDLNESLFGANPANTDSDGDGMADGEEVAQGYDPVIPMRVYRVDVNNTSGVEDGLSWGTAFSSIQPAMDEAQRRGEGQVWVATGVYTATTDFVVVLKRHVALLGGFNGAEINPEARDWTAYPTIIDGQSARPCIQGANGAVLDGFTVQNGLAQYYGGGMLNEGTAPRIIHCIFKQNSASYGGAIYNLKASPSITECKFLANTASDGAGIYDYASTPVISNCVFDQNTARYSGGGICDYNNSAPIIQACTFIANTASSSYKGGGAMYVVSSSPVLTNCLFARNSALKGAALYLYSQPDFYYDYFKGDAAAPSVMNCVFANNLADTLGGALYNSSDTAPVITNSIFWNNLAGDVIDEIQTSDFGVAPLITYSCIDVAYEGIGNLISDPLFLDPANDDYRLQSGSPCIDTGRTYDAPNTDILGAPRPQGGGFDMGAYEYVP